MKLFASLDDPDGSVRYLFDWHQNVEFGRKVVTCRIAHFVSNFVAVQVISLPLWAIALWVAYRIGIASAGR